MSAYCNGLDANDEDNLASSWGEIGASSTFSLLWGLGFVALFEICRRHPTVADVFDSRRRQHANESGGRAGGGAG
eukprot:CAMPEP_0194342088 /NCGR_PEP_ID=MMETSP0171-20130528/91770_1 /TAXON_ID=218684 /ORGANISM="Corethron pennatum, Strain L29A3" /LENGTH=74 /DNA_ID=CAMNT_0039107675 /DNA_START=190 /DNA_END=411 /DNA_ORIENTATION=-